MFKTILIANRGEIACRIIKTARRMGIRTIAVYSDADAQALHVRMADDAVLIGGAASRDSYLRGEVIIRAALEKGAEAIHPGYGFLSENEKFAKDCAKAGLVFIGPTPKAMNAMALKDKAKAIMSRAGVPIVPGYMGENQTPSFLKKEAEKIHYPVLIKAVAGGGGKGMRLVEKAEDFGDALKSCQREALASFGNAHVLIEKYVTKPRHVEVQVFGDTKGNAVHLFERDCSVQRRHQKVVEEAPAPGLPDSVRQALGEAAVKAVKALGYTNAGTIEFIMDSKNFNFYFMEMNTRLQVEHPVTEMITGLDLVEWQLRVAAGEALPLTQEQITARGHAFEVRLYAEDPATGFLPQTGKIERFIQPEAARVDTGVAEGDNISIHYDPMIAKIIVHGDDRVRAIAAMQVALSDLAVVGLKTNQEFLSHLFENPAFIKGDVDTGFIARHEKSLVPDTYGRADKDELALAAIYYLARLGEGRNEQDPWDTRDNWRMGGMYSRTVQFLSRDKIINVTVNAQGHDFIIDGTRYTFDSFQNNIISLNQGGITGAVLKRREGIVILRNGRVVDMQLYKAGSGHEEGGENRIIAPMPGMIVSVSVKLGEKVSKGQPLLVMEAMKMEMTIRAGCDGVVKQLPAKQGQQVIDGALLAEVAA